MVSTTIAREGEQPRARNDLRPALELDQRHQHREQEHVEHRPRPDRVDELVELACGCAAARPQPMLEVTTSENRPASLKSGITMLAMNTIKATAHWSCSVSNLMPSQTVLSE